ncbi:hypothetical protein C9415_21610 [Kluyvera sp. Nf5]|nr:hypothetical protein C9415_21610 [Kluyvera sp. Nf5]
MNKALISLPFILFLSGCMSPSELRNQQVERAKTLQEKRDILLTDATIGSRTPLFERELLLSNGKETDAFLSDLIRTCKASEDRDCVKDFYSNAADEAIKKNREKCFIDPTCKKETLKSENARELNSQYYQFVYHNQYQSGDADSMARMVCKAIANNQKAGMPYEQAEETVRDISGIEPISREILVKLGNACWQLSYLGVKNPISEIKPRI